MMSEMLALLSLLVDVKSMSIGITLSLLCQEVFFFLIRDVAVTGVSFDSSDATPGLLAPISLIKRSHISLTLRAGFANCIVADTFSF
jgi:hypothetical protein